MAIKYEDYTEKQRSEMTKISARATRYKMKIDAINKRLAEPVISFEENKKLRETLTMFKELFKKATEEIVTISKQRSIYDKHLKEAQKHLDAAENLRKKWGF